MAVVEHRLVENLIVGHRHHAAGVLPRMDPRRRLGGLLGRRLAHFHDRGLDEAQADHVAAHAPHHDPVADIECPAAENHEISGKRRDHLLQRDRQAGREQPEHRRELRRIIEPNRDHPQHENRRQNEANRLARPEAGAAIEAAANRPCGNSPEQPTPAPR